MHKKEQEYFEIIENIFKLVKAEENLGETANYIPELAKVYG